MDTELAAEIAAIESELYELQFATPWNDIHAKKLADRRAALERHLARMKALA